LKFAIFTTSQKLYEPAIDFYRGILRKTALRYPDLTLRTPQSPGGHTRDLIEFAELIGLKIDYWAPMNKWGNSASEIRLKGMLRGYEFDPERCGRQYRDPVTDWPYPVREEPPTDLVLIFSGRSDGDTANDLARLTLKGGSRYALHVYKEKWTKKRGNDPVFKHIVHKARFRHRPFEFDPAESLVWVPDQERKAA
jgi:hypothetical protein